MLSEVRSFEIKWICRPIRQIQPETKESLVSFFKILIQLYLLCSFLYSLTYCIKEVINGKIFWRLKEKMLALEAATAWIRGISCNFFFKTLILLYLFCLFLYFWLTVSKRVSKAIFLDITFKSVGLWGRYGLKQGNPLYLFQNTNPIIFVMFIPLFFDLLYQIGI